MAATDEDRPAAESLAPNLAELTESQDWAALVAAIQCVIDGERDEASLLSGLEPIDTAILSRILQSL